MTEDERYLLEEDFKRVLTSLEAKLSVRIKNQMDDMNWRWEVSAAILDILREEFKETRADNYFSDRIGYL